MELITGIEKGLPKKTINSSANQYTSCIYWFLIKLQKVIINRIHNRYKLDGDLHSGGGGLFKQ